MEQTQDPSFRSQRGRIGAWVVHSRYDSKQLTANGRSKFLAGFEDQVDPDRLLDPAERERRAQAALNAHMTRLALKSAKARRRKAAP